MESVAKEQRRELGAEKYQKYCKANFVWQHAELLIAQKVSFLVGKAR